LNSNLSTKFFYGYLIKQHLRRKNSRQQNVPGATRKVALNTVKPKNSVTLQALFSLDLTLYTTIGILLWGVLPAMAGC